MFTMDSNKRAPVCRCGEGHSSPGLHRPSGAGRFLWRWLPSAEDAGL